MRALAILPFLALATASSPLNKRCSPLRDPELYQGYLPPVACWQDQDTACRAYIQEGTELVLDPAHKLAIIYGVSDYCTATIAEELARAADSRKEYGWEQKHGKLHSIGNGILVISEMPDAAIKQYAALKYKKDADPNAPWKRA